MRQAREKATGGEKDARGGMGIEVRGVGTQSREPRG